MHFRKTRRLAAILLAAATIFTDFQGSQALIQAAQTESQAMSEFDFASAKAAFARLQKDYTLYGILTNDTQIPIYHKASLQSTVLNTLASGSQVKLENTAWDGQNLWFLVSFTANDTVCSGYIQSDYVVTADERFAEWESRYLPDKMTDSLRRGASKAASQASAFPKSYQAQIKKLVQAHPNWTFVPMNTGLDWSDVVKAEMADSRNLVQTIHPNSWKSKNAKDYNAGTGQWVIKSGTDWVQASESIVKYYLDPRNFLNEESVFQFEQLVYGKHHKKAGVEKILNGTFMSHKKLEDGSGGKITYAQAFMKIGKSLKVSPYFLASRVRQEQGTSGNSPLISGKYPGYKGYYNYFNRRASGVGDEVFRRGLEEAKANGWNTRYKSLKGGAKSVASDFIYKGQDTFYLQKFDVDASYDGLYWHQYMQNLLAADNEGKSVQKSYSEMGILDNRFVFKIPVYKNMPSSPCPMPKGSSGKPDDEPADATIPATSWSKLKVKNYKTIELSWKKKSVDGYKIYRKTGNGKYSCIETLKGKSSCSFKDTSVKPGHIYTYRIRGYKTIDGKKRYSPYTSGRSTKLQMEKPVLKKASASGSKQVKLSWERDAKADGYYIYRASSKKGSFKKVASIAKNKTLKWTDKNIKAKKTYYYKIRSYVNTSSGTKTSGFSKVLQVKVPKK